MTFKICPQRIGKRTKIDQGKKDKIGQGKRTKLARAKDKLARQKIIHGNSLENFPFFSREF